MARDGWDGDDQDGLWLDDGGSPGRAHRRGYRTAAMVAAAATCLAAVGIPVGLVLADSGGSPAVAMPPDHHHTSNGAPVVGGPAEQQVLSALSATTDAGSFDFTYDMTRTAPTSAATSTTTTVGAGTECRAAVQEVHDGVVRDLTARTGTVCTTSRPAIGPATPNEQSGTAVSGAGVINTSPMGMVASTNLGVDVRVDGTRVWEGGGTGLAPEGNLGSGTALASFAGLVEGTLGTRAGGVAMLGMASPTGYLDLAQGAVNGADQLGTGTVGGFAVTEYQVALDPTQLAQAPGITAEEASAIQGALQVLRGEGLSGIQDDIWVDASGFIRKSVSVAEFSDGGAVTLTATFSNFGCAGTVLMPGQSGPAAPPAGCISPDTGTPTTTVPATTVPVTTVPATTTVPTTTPATTAATTSTLPTPPASTTTTTTPPGPASVPGQAPTTTTTTP